MFPDTIATAHNGIAKAKAIKAVTIPEMNIPTKLHDHRKTMR